MKFESKYLIRWGIPGWLFIFWLVYSYAVIKNINPLEFSSNDLSTSITLLVSLTALGVPVGYVMHQLYFGLLWVFNLRKRKFNDFVVKVGDKFPKPNDWDNYTSAEKYYHIEFVWHTMLIEQCEESRTYLEGRYRHLLGTVHSLGALFVSSALSFTSSAIVANYITFADKEGNYFLFAVGLLFQGGIFLASVANYTYFSKNIRALQIKVLNKYLTKEPSSE